MVHSCGAVAAGMRVRAVSHVALGEEKAHTAAASANAIATAARGRPRSAPAGARFRFRAARSAGGFAVTITGFEVIGPLVSKVKRSDDGSNDNAKNAEGRKEGIHAHASSIV